MTKSLGECLIEERGEMPGQAMRTTTLTARATLDSMTAWVGGQTEAGAEAGAKVDFLAKEESR